VWSEKTKRSLAEPWSMLIPRKIQSEEGKLKVNLGSSEVGKRTKPSHGKNKISEGDRMSKKIKEDRTKMNE
jgi:hypothetical protein